MVHERTFWGIHAGRTGDAETLFKKHTIVAIGWKEVGELTSLKTRDDFKEVVAKTYPDKKPGAIPNNAGQLYRFVHEMNVRDIVVFPLKREREIWLGEVVGEYEYNPKLDSSFPNLRKVKWLRKHPRTRFSQGALYEIGSAMTFFQVKNYADEFLAALEQREFQPVSEQEDEEAIGIVAEDIERQSRDFVLKQLSARLKGHGLTHLVAHLLLLMGYKTNVSPPGPDRGIDIHASKDDLGVEQPKLLVQVKSGDDEVKESEVQRLYGNVSEREFGLFVSLGDFRKSARDFAFGKHNLKLIGGDELVDLIYKHYDRLAESTKASSPSAACSSPKPSATKRLRRSRPPADTPAQHRSYRRPHISEGACGPRSEDEALSIAMKKS